MNVAYKQLVPFLKGIIDNEENYRIREVLLYKALGVASYFGLPCGIRLDPKEPEWPVIFFELPTGQVSWHVSQHPKEWDGHSTEEKHRRVSAFLNTIDLCQDPS